MVVDGTFPNVLLYSNLMYLFCEEPTEKMLGKGKRKTRRVIGRIFCLKILEWSAAILSGHWGDVSCALSHCSWPPHAMEFTCTLGRQD